MKRGNTDPFDKDLKVNDKIVNKFALNVREVIEDSQKKVSAEHDKKMDELSLTSIETQTDLEVRSENDIALIDFYERFCSRLYNPIKIMTTKIEKENEDENLTQNIELDWAKFDALKGFRVKLVDQTEHINQLRDSKDYNHVNLFGYQAFASMRNHFSMRVFYLIRLMNKHQNQEAERKDFIFSYWTK